MAFRYSPRVVTDGLVFAVDAGNVKSYPGSGSVWYDLSGNGNHGTLTNGPTFDSNNRGSISFDGGDDKISGFSPITLQTEWTICYWFYHSGGGNNMTIGEEETNENRFYHRNTTGYLLRVHNNSNSYTDMIIGDDKRDTWTFLSYGLNTTSQYGWINGTQIHDIGYAGDTTFVFDCIGKAYSSGYQWSGKIAQLMIYTKKLTTQEVLQNYNAHKSRFGL